MAAPGPIVAAVLLLAGLIFPLVITNETATQIAVDTLLYVAAAVAWNLFSGFSGYISLGTRGVLRSSARTRSASPPRTGT
jgi:ABC-type branched-subunit amino acid transport system permease subunit